MAVADPRGPRRAPWSQPGDGMAVRLALGLHRRSRQIVLLSLLPIAFGHALSIWSVAASVMILGSVVDGQKLRFTADVIQILWAAFEALYRHRHRVRVGMTIGLGGLFLWSL
jgi:hypothetical protein